MKKQKIICVVGPTASVKTGLGIELAKCFDGEVISADSMQIYRDMHIASAAPDNSETQGIPHHLVEFLPYGSSYTVADYVKAAREKIEEIASRGKIPIVVGGTGLYINSLVNNVEFVEQETALELRERITEEFDRIGELFGKCLGREFGRALTENEISAVSVSFFGIYFARFNESLPDGAVCRPLSGFESLSQSPALY